MRPPFQTLDATLQASINTVIDYNWSDEVDDAVEQESLDGHILHALLDLANWRDGTETTIVEAIQETYPDWEPPDDE